MIYIIIAIVLVVLGMFFLDKKSLQSDIKAEGGIEQRYRDLVDGIIYKCPNPEIKEYNGYLSIRMTTKSITTLFELTPAFNVVGVLVSIEYGESEKIVNRWEFNEEKYTQHDMMKEIGSFMVDIHNKLQNNLSEAADVSLEEMIKDIAMLPLDKKIELAILLYISGTTNEQKARILNIWYQCSHENPFSDWLEEQFEKFEPKIIFKPVYFETEENYQIILKSVENISEYKGIEEVILNGVACTKEIFEIDRLLFILLSIKSSNRLYAEILNLSYQNWTNGGKTPFHYNFLLLKTRLDILMVKEQYEEALNTASEIYEILEEQFSNGELPWLKYQYTNSLILLTENGYSSSTYPKELLIKNMIKFEEEGYVEDMIFKQMYKQ